MSTKKKLEEVLQLVKRSNDEVEALKKEGKDNSEKLEGIVKDLFEKRRAAMDEDLVNRFRKGEHLSVDGDEKSSDGTPMIVSKAADANARRLQEFNDDVYIVSKMLRVHPTQTKMWKKNQAAVGELRKAVNVATTTQGGNWVPVELSADVIDKFRLALKVGALFKRIQMPTNPYDVPVVSADATPKLVSESTVDSASKFTASTPTTRKLRLSAQKLVTRTVFSEEATEDMVTPVLPWLKDNLAISMARGFENALINGDFTSVVHMDSDSNASDNVVKAYDGLRRTIKTSGVAGVDMGSTNFTTAKLRTVRSQLGKYGVDPKSLVLITSPIGYANLLGLAEVITMEKYGTAATIVTGELARIDGIPVVVSEFVRTDLNASGYYDSTTPTKSEIILAWTPGWWIGDRRLMTLKTFEDIQVDQTILVTTMRAAFGTPYDPTTETMASFGYNIA
jgi:HK97 family phage major capsid protein